MMDIFIAYILLCGTTIGVLGNPALFGYQQPLPFGYQQPLPFGYQQPLPFGYQQPLPLGYRQPLPLSYQQPRGYFSYNALQSPAATLPQHYYSPPDNTYSGFSYQTDYQNGGRSQVVFVSGPQSHELMEQSLSQFRQIQPVQYPTPTPASDVNSTVSLEADLSEVRVPADKISAIPQPSVSPVPLPQQPLAPLPVFRAPQPPVASVYRVQVYPSHQPSPFLHTPFPYHPFVSTFYNTVTSTVNGTNAPQPAANAVTPDNASESQESRIVPVQLAKRIDDDIVTNEATATTTVQLSNRIDDFVANSESASISTTTVAMSSSVADVSSDAVTSTTPAEVPASSTSAAEPSSTTESATTALPVEPDDETNDDAESTTMPVSEAPSADESSTMEGSSMTDVDTDNADQQTTTEA